MKYIFFLFSFCFVTQVGAQAPGFMGKRFSVFIDANPTPALFVQNVNNQVAGFAEYARTSDVNRFAFNIRPQLTTEYLIKRDWSIGVSYSMIRMGTTSGTLTSSNPTDYSINLDVAKGSGIGFHLKHYQFGRSGSIAPIGFYRTLSVYTTITNTYENKDSKVKKFQNDFIYPVVTVGLGRQTMLAKNLLLKTGIEFGWAFVPTNFLSETESEWNPQEYAGYNLHASLAGYYLLSLNLALGYTLF